MKKRIVITGLGVLVSNGLSVSEFWDALISGRSGIGKITKFDTSDYPSKIAGEIKGFDPLNYIDRKEIRHTDPYAQYGICTSVEAVKDAGLDMASENLERIGVIFGSGIGGTTTWEEQHKILLERGMNRISPFFVPMMIPNIAAGLISIKLGIKGPNYALVSACTTSAHTIGNAAIMIERGDADVMIAGGAEAAITPMAVGGFCALRALSTSRNDEPSRASRPFDALRDGFVMSEGAGTVVLESLEHALAKGARIYGEIIGIGQTGDAYHITAPPPDAEGGARAMLAAIKDAGIQPEEVDYINAHGTSTDLNDKSETIAIKTVFGEHAYKLAISSTKSMTGHLLGAAGAVELAATVLAINNSIIPPTINYENPDPDCDLDYTPNQAVKRQVRVALTNSFGFGGHNGVLAVKRYEP